MLYTHIKSFKEPCSLFTRPARALAGVMLAVLAAACESPPLELNEAAKFALKLQTLQKHREAQEQAILLEVEKKQQRQQLLELLPKVPSFSPKITTTTYTEFFVGERPLEEQVLSMSTEVLQQRYVNSGTTPGEAMLLLNELVRRQLYELHISTVIARIELTQQEKVADVNAYVELLSRFFPKVSASAQLRIIAFVKESWQKDPFTQSAYTLAHSVMLRSAKTPDVRDQVWFLIRTMERSTLVSASQDVRYDLLDVPAKQPRQVSALYAAGGGRE